MVAALWVLLIGAWGVDIAIINREKKARNVNSTIALWPFKARAKDFILDVLNIGITWGLIKIGSPKVSVFIAWPILIIAVIALLVDIYRATKY